VWKHDYVFLQGVRNLCHVEECCLKWRKHWPKVIRRNALLRLQPALNARDPQPHNHPVILQATLRTTRFLARAETRWRFSNLPKPGLFKETKLTISSKQTFLHIVEATARNTALPPSTPNHTTRKPQSIAALVAKRMAPTNIYVCRFCIAAVLTYRSSKSFGGISCLLRKWMVKSWAKYARVRIGIGASLFIGHCWTGC